MGLWTHPPTRNENDTGLHVLDMNLALESYRRAFLSIMETTTQLEADMIRERTRSGIEAAKAAEIETIEREVF